MAVEAAPRLEAGEVVEAVARVAVAKRDGLFRAHRRRLSVEDLEDLYGQVTLELIARAQRGNGFASELHIAHSLEQKFESRVTDRWRMLGFRSQFEAGPTSRGDIEAVADPSSADHDAIADAVAARQELARLREVADELTDDQRLVLACQIGLGMQMAEFCARFGWSADKFRKTAQRARARLRELHGEYETGKRCRRLRRDIDAYVGKAADEVQKRRVEVHFENCGACLATACALERTQAGLAILLPMPAMASVGLIAKLGAAVAGVKRLVSGWHDDGGVVTGTGGATVAAGGSAAGIGALKAGVAALCVGGAVGGYSVCKEAGLFAAVPTPDQRIAASRDEPPSKGRNAASAAGVRPSAIVKLTRPATAQAVPRSSRRTGAKTRDEQVEREFGRRQPSASAAQATTEFQAPAKAATRAPAASSGSPSPEPEPMPSGSGSTGEFGFE